MQLYIDLLGVVVIDIMVVYQLFSLIEVLCLIGVLFILLGICLEIV